MRSVWGEKMTQPIKVQLTLPQMAIVTSYQRLIAHVQIEAAQAKEVWSLESVHGAMTKVAYGLEKELTEFLRHAHSGIVIAQNVPPVIQGVAK